MRFRAGEPGPERSSALDVRRRGRCITPPCEDDAPRAGAARLFCESRGLPPDGRAGDAGRGRCARRAHHHQGGALYVVLAQEWGRAIDRRRGWPADLRGIPDQARRDRPASANPPDAVRPGFDRRPGAGLWRHRRKGGASRARASRRRLGPGAPCLRRAEVAVRQRACSSPPASASPVMASCRCSTRSRIPRARPRCRDDPEAASGTGPGTWRAPGWRRSALMILLAFGLIRAAVMHRARAAGRARRVADHPERAAAGALLLGAAAAGRSRWHYQMRFMTR